jgi:5-methyltetrahydrofolate--homocysteine methyltransferase
MRPTFTELLAQPSPILYDGATGTLLQAFDLPMGTAPEKWVLENPASVYIAAEAYVNAGSQIILTCTFGGTAFRLLSAGLDDHAEEINRRAVELAKEAAGERALVAGSMGPLGRMALILAEITFPDAVEQFAQQAQALAGAGVDLLQVESMSDLEEVRAAIEGIRQVTQLPIFVTLSFDTGGRTLAGTTPLLAARELAGLGVAAMGANCGSGPENMAEILSEMRSAAPDAVLIAKPNAGLPTIHAGQAVYSMEPEPFATFAMDWIKAGAKIVGGCCGTTPRYIEEMRRRLKDEGRTTEDESSA